MLIFITRFFGSRRKANWPPGEPIESVSDEALMIMFASGTHEAFEALLSRHERGVYNFVLRSVKTPARAEDLTQDIFFRVIRSASKYKKSAKFTTWLYTIARNICIDQSRRKSNQLEVSINRTLSRSEDEGGKTFLDTVVSKDANSGGVEVVKQEFRERLQEALDSLPEEQREVFLLREVSGLKFREIADTIGVPENTVKSRMRYALSTLQGYLEEFRGYSFDKDQAKEVGGT